MILAAGIPDVTLLSKINSNLFIKIYPLWRRSMNYYKKCIKNKLLLTRGKVFEKRHSRIEVPRTAFWSDNKRCHFKFFKDWLGPQILLGQFSNTCLIFSAVCSADTFFCCIDNPLLTGFHEKVKHTETKLSWWIKTNRWKRLVNLAYSEGDWILTMLGLKWKNLRNMKLFETIHNYKKLLNMLILFTSHWIIKYL